MEKKSFSTNFLLEIQNKKEKIKSKIRDSNPWSLGNCKYPTAKTTELSSNSTYWRWILAYKFYCWSGWNEHFLCIWFKKLFHSTEILEGGSSIHRDLVTKSYPVWTLLRTIFFSFSFLLEIQLRSNFLNPMHKKVHFSLISSKT